MDYLKNYIDLITKAQERELPGGYTEKHHVFPVSIFGKNNALVVLTTKEHYVAHHLLWKFYRKEFGKKDSRTHSMYWAFRMMASINKEVRVVARVYSLLRSEIKQFYTPERLKKMSAASKGRIHSKETRIKMSLSGKGKKRTLETRAKMSKLAKIRGISAETRVKLNASNVGRKRTLEQRRQISERNKGKCLGKKASLETRRKMSIARKGKPRAAFVLSEDGRNRILESNKRNSHIFQDEKFRIKTSERVLSYRATRTAEEIKRDSDNLIAARKSQKEYLLKKHSNKINKICFECKIEKPIEKFNLLKRSLDGHGSYCKECRAIKGKAEKLKAKEKRKQEQRHDVIE